MVGSDNLGIRRQLRAWARLKCTCCAYNAAITAVLHKASILALCYAGWLLFSPEVGESASEFAHLITAGVARLQTELAGVLFRHEHTPGLPVREASKVTTQLHSTRCLGFQILGSLINSPTILPKRLDPSISYPKSSHQPRSVASKSSQREKVAIH